MTTLRFVTAPPTPDDILDDDWEAQWRGLVVNAATDSVGYLGEGAARIYDERWHHYRDPTPHDSMSFVTTKLKDCFWVSRNELVNSSESAVPTRHLILAWLEAVPQQSRVIFAIPKDMVEVIT